MNADVTNDPVLSADFADRVLARADVLVARRRFVWRATAGGAVLCFLSLALVSWSMMSGAPQPAPHGAARQLVAYSSNTDETSTNETDGLADLFPDAAPVARFATEYSDDAEDSDTAILPDEDAES